MLTGGACSSSASPPGTCAAAATRGLFRAGATIALWAALVAGAATVLIGHEQGQLMTRQQPMKMAAAEALYTTESGAHFSLFALGPWQRYPDSNVANIALPHALSILATNSWNGTVAGMNDVQAQYEAAYGPGNYKPIVGITYWTFRIMTGIGFLAVLIAAAGLWLARGPRGSSAAAASCASPSGRSRCRCSRTSPAGCSPRWAASPGSCRACSRRGTPSRRRVGAWSVGLTLAGFTLLYGVLAVVEGALMIRAAKAGPDPEGAYGAEPGGDGSEPTIPALTY